MFEIFGCNCTLSKLLNVIKRSTYKIVYYVCIQILLTPLIILCPNDKGVTMRAIFKSPAG